LFSIEGRRMRAFKAAEATGVAMVVFVDYRYGSRRQVVFCGKALPEELLIRAKQEGCRRHDEEQERKEWRVV
jgi:hypothetical protein